MSRILERADEGKVSILFHLKRYRISMKDNKQLIMIFVDLSRQRVEWVQFVGWLLNRFHTEITARNQMFRHLELLVCESS
jgi:hypothetical protein